MDHVMQNRVETAAHPENDVFGQKMLTIPFIHQRMNNGAPIVLNKIVHNAQKSTLNTSSDTS